VAAGAAAAPTNYYRRAVGRRDARASSSAGAVGGDDDDDDDSASIGNNAASTLLGGDHVVVGVVRGQLHDARLVERLVGVPVGVVVIFLVGIAQLGPPPAFSRPVSPPALLPLSPPSNATSDRGSVVAALSTARAVLDPGGRTSGAKSAGPSSSSTTIDFADDGAIVARVIGVHALDAPRHGRRHRRRIG
jgi:hypothetical protein